MSETLTEKLEALDISADFSDPQTYSKLMGYGDEQVAEPAEPEAKGETEPPAAVEPTPVAPPESSAPPAVVETIEQEPAGIATKDGKHVIPMAVLTDTRLALQKANDRAKELAEANERLKQELSAKQQAAQETEAAKATEVTDEELAAIEADFPEIGAQMAKLAKANRALQAQVQEVALATRQPAAKEAEPQINLQELIDQRPLLSQWQAKGGVVWRAAIEADQELAADPAWATQPMAERFAEAERRVAEQLGIPVATQVAEPTPTTSVAAPVTPKPGPTTPAAQPVATTVMPTLTDFNGSPATVGDPMAAMPVGKMVDTAMNMDMESLRKMVGLSY